MVHGLPLVDEADRICEACLAGKHRRAPFPRQALNRAKDVLELVHADLCGPISPATPGGKRYFLLLVDDKSRHMWLYLLKTKDEAATTLKKFQAAAELESGRRLKTLRTDRGGEFTSLSLGEYYADQGVQRQLTAPYTPQQNGVVERRNQTIVGMARSLLKAKNVPARFWGEAVTTAVYLLNRGTTKSVEKMTPLEAWSGRRPSVQHLRTFGCVAHVKVTRPDVKKLDDRSMPMVLLGYEPGSAAYRVFHPPSGRVHVSRDIVFDEDSTWDWMTEAASGEQGSIPESFTIEHTFWPGAGSYSSSTVDAAPTSPAAATTPVVTMPSSPAGAASPVPVTPSPATPGVEFVSPPSGASVPSPGEEAPRRYRTLENLFDTTTTVETDHGDICLFSGEEPGSFNEAETEQGWRDAMNEEMKSINENRTWELCKLPPGHRAIGLKWVYKLKKDAHGAVVKRKARLVAKGYVQRQGVDFDDVFAPVARMDSVRVLIALAAHEGWQVHHMDVKSAFLNGDLLEEVYVQQPLGYVKAGDEDKVLRLRKALYGLRQAPRAWNAKLDDSLNSLGFERCPSEHAVYRRGTGDSLLLVGVYVDDLVITGQDTKEIDHFKQQMTKLFSMSDLGKLSFYLGIEVAQERDRIMLCQAAYAKRLLERTGMTDCNPCTTPMEARLKLSKQGAGDSVDLTLYRSVIGGLRYLTHTRPDITFAVGYLSRFMEAPTTEHYAAVKHLLRYIAGTLDHGCAYSRGKGTLELTGYSDSDHAGDIDDRKSTTGVIFFLGGSPVSWQSQKQRVVAISSCEAEYMAATTAACQGIWLARLLGEMLNEKPVKPKLLVDNKSAISLSKNPVFHERSKHIDIRYHFIRECVEQGRVGIDYIRTNDQLADVLTKALGRLVFQGLRRRIGMSEIIRQRQD
jgi:transposase InsO family protein